MGGDPFYPEYAVQIRGSCCQGTRTDVAPVTSILPIAWPLPLVVPEKEDSKGSPRPLAISPGLPIWGAATSCPQAHRGAHDASVPWSTSV